MLSVARMRMFTAVIEEGSFTAAAERLHATQSGISQQIAKLERSLGMQLIERGPNGATATPAGRQLYARSIALLREIASVERGITDFGRGASGRLTLGVMPALTRSQVGPVLRRYRTDNPNVTVNILERASSELIEEVAGNRLDAAIVPVFNAPASLRCRLLGRTSEVLVARASKDNTHMSPVDVETLSPVRLILQSEGHIRRRRVLAYLRSKGVEIEALMDLDSMFATLEFVQNSDFVTMLPAIMVSPEIESGAMCVRPLASGGFTLDVMAVEPERREPSPILAELLSLFERSLADFESGFNACVGRPGVKS